MLLIDLQPNQQIFNWQPDFYDDVNSLPGDMPEDLKEYIRQQPAAERKQIWVSCRGEKAADEENIGNINFFPTRGFPGYFYPYRNVKGYVSPLIAIQFANPKRKKNNENLISYLQYSFYSS